MKRGNNKGFTLIEILIVVAIIGILASIVLVNVRGFRAKGQDARRIADIRTIQNGLELYYSSEGKYPTVTVFCADPIDMKFADVGVNVLPKDPTLDTCYLYGTDTTGTPPDQSYVLGAVLSDEGHQSLKNDIDGPPIDNFGVDCGLVPPGADTIYCVKF